ncbi:MAG: hypothetical protein KA538_07920, partial [Azonexus sp.]|nr:hypothetical protein [Azonexus sp.]
AIRHLLDRFDLEFFRVTLAAHDFSFCLSLRLRSVYWFRGDSGAGYPRVTVRLELCSWLRL